MSQTLQTIRTNLVNALIETLVKAGVPRATAEKFANAKKLCFSDMQIAGVLSRQYILADECTGDWQEADID